MSVYDYRFGPRPPASLPKRDPDYYLLQQLNMSEEMRSGYADRQAS